MMKKQLAACVHKIYEKSIYEYYCIRLEWRKIGFFQVREDTVARRRQALAP